MKFSRLAIRNFRSIGPNGLEMIFSGDQNLTAFVGPNASGKTNILTALGVVLGVYPFSRFTSEEIDFCNRQTDEELLIELYLDPPILEYDVYRRPFTIAGFRYRVTRYRRGDRRGALYTEHYCFDEEGKTVVKPGRIFPSRGKPDDGIENSQRPIPVNEQAWKLGDLFYLDAPTLERFFDRTTGYSPLGRLSEIYREDFEADHNQYSPDGGVTIRSRGIPTGIFYAGGHPSHTKAL